jgi:hypothetical protein
LKTFKTYLTENYNTIWEDREGKVVFIKGVPIKDRGGLSYIEWMEAKDMKSGSVSKGGETYYAPFTKRKIEKDNIVSFDFDDTIFMLDWDFENSDFVRDENGNPTGKLNTKIAKKIKEYKTNGYTVYLITSRYAVWREEVENYLKDNNLMGYIDDVIFTNGESKSITCKKLGVVKHYDDDRVEIRDLENVGIEGVLV